MVLDVFTLAEEESAPLPIIKELKNTYIRKLIRYNQFYMQAKITGHNVDVEKRETFYRNIFLLMEFATNIFITQVSHFLNVFRIPSTNLITKTLDFILRYFKLT